MCGKEPDRKPRSRGGVAMLAMLCAVCAAAPARAADGLWDRVLEQLDIKAAAPGRAADFVERTRPDPSGLGYIPPAVPHKVSPLAVKTPAQIQAEKDALDAAKVRQLTPAAPAPLQIAKTKKPGKAKAAAPVAD